MRSRRLKPGQQTQLDVTFYTRVDGPGRHGEIVRLYTNHDPTPDQFFKRPLKTEVAFFITVDR